MGTLMKPRSLALGLLGFLVLICLPANAGTIIPSSFTADTATFNNITIWYVSANPLSNPFGLANPNGPAVANPVTSVMGNDGLHASSVETVVLKGGATPGLDIGTGSVSVPNDVFLAALTGFQIFSGPTSAPTLTPTITPFDFTASGDFLGYRVASGAGDYAFNPGIQDIFVTIYDNNVISVLNSSIEVAFQLPGGTDNVVPEPGTLLLLGGGMMALVFGLRRRKS